MKLPPDSVDVCILGCGIQGLLALRGLAKKELTAVLLDIADLGAGETGHSQAILHRGGVYTDLRRPSVRDVLFKHFAGALPNWTQAEMQAHLNGRTTENVHYGYRLPEQLAAQSALLSIIDPQGRPGQTFPVESPDLAGCFISTERSVDVQGLLRSLHQAYGKYTRKIQTLKSCQVTDASITLGLQLPSGDTIDLSAQRVVVAVGREHQNVWNTLGVTPPQHVFDDYRTRPKWNFLALRGPGSRLPKINAFLPELGNTSIVARQRDSRVTWLMTSNGLLDSSGWLIKSRSLKDRLPPLGDWGRILLDQVWRLFPEIARYKDELEYHLYQVPEPQSPSEFVEHIPNPHGIHGDRMLILHPCRLTMAPKLVEALCASNSITELTNLPRWVPNLAWGQPLNAQATEYWELPFVKWAKCP